MGGLLMCISVVLTIGLSAASPDKYQYVTKHIEMPVDHFSFSTNASFQLRYLWNDTWWVPGGPIFFYTGNEGDINMFAQNTGFMWDIAAEFSALLLFAEHRYYGESLPWGNKSYSDASHLGHLTSSQALEDFVQLIAVVKASLSANHSPVIAFGGSYGGMLAAWLRMKYPFAVAGAIAGSAPILQFTGLTACNAFGEIVTADFKMAGRECSKTIRKSWIAIKNVTSNDEGKKWLSTAWQLCDPLKNDGDVATLKAWLADIYTNLAMVDYPYPANFLAPLPANPIDAVCQYLRNSSLADHPLLQSVRRGLEVYVNYTGQAKCLDVKASATPSLGDEGWSYQACTEMVMPMCNDGRRDMFEPSPWNLKEYSDACFKRWGVRPQENLIVNRYGGRDLTYATNIVFSNGLLDPWSSGGVLRNVSRSAIAVLIPEGAHHLDLRAAHSADPPSVVLARNYHRQAIRGWVDAHHTQHNHFNAILQ